MRHDLTIMQVQAVMLHLREMLGDDEDDQLIVDTLEGETDLFELCARLLRFVEEDEGSIASLKKEIENRQLRKKRFEDRIARNREAIMALMQAAERDKLTLPEATLSVRELKASLKINEERALPDEYVTMTPKPNMDAIKSAFSVEDDALPNWLRVEPARPSLTVRRS